MQKRSAWSRAALALIGTLLAACATEDPQRADTTYSASVQDPAYPTGQGPLLCVDHGHHNFHRIDGRFAPFAALARADGLRVEPVHRAFDGGIPGRCRVLVIANARPSGADWDAYPYPTPSAFSPAEIERIVQWVRNGGSLLLAADHLPLAGAAATLADALGCQFLDGFAVAGFTTEAQARENFLRPTRFSLADGSLREGPGTAGRSPAHSVTAVATFVGQAFRCDEPATPILVLPANFVSLMPRTAWQFSLETPRIPVGGWLQGAALEIGLGRVAIFGEAGMFTAQITEDGRKMGMNAPGAEQNARFVRNVIQWLATP